MPLSTFLSIAQAASELKDLPDIEAEKFPVKIVRRSSSNRIYLLEVLDDRQPRLGNLILLRKSSRPIMAFRVIRTYVEDKQIAVKRVKRYRPHRFLKSGVEYVAIEKVSDITYEPSEQDRKDLDELDHRKGNRAQRDLLDEAADAEGKKRSQDDDSEDVVEDEEDSHLAVAIEEVKPIETTSQWLTAGFGFVRNNGPPNMPGSYLFSSGNVRYGITLLKRILMKRSGLQDSLVAEGGFYIYKSIGYVSQGDAYTVFSGVGTARYNILFSEAFGIFFYAGYMQSIVIGASQAVDEGLRTLNSQLPVVGGGFLFQVGPSWYTRVDAGLDSVSINLTLKF